MSSVIKTLIWKWFFGTTPKPIRISPDHLPGLNPPKPAPVIPKHHSPVEPEKQSDVERVYEIFKKEQRKFPDEKLPPLRMDRM